jgi:Dehydrogenases with different specificities (related to short-chain alcohol dehydrogenases)
LDYQSLFDLKGLNAIVVGGGAGIGEGVCNGYADFGANVAVVDLNLEDAEKVSKGLIQKGVKSAAFQCDVTDPDEVRNVVRQVVDIFGSIDILFNSAGIGMRHKAEDMPEEVFDKVMKVNLYGTFHFCREVGQQMIKLGLGGKIINMASISAHVGIPETVNYCASKGGVVAFSRCLATEWAEHNINVNTISPSHIRTAMIQRVMDKDPTKEAFFRENILLDRLGEVKDVVGSAIFLAASAGDFITGTTLIVDGGHSAR